MGLKIGLCGKIEKLKSLLPISFLILSAFFIPPNLVQQAKATSEGLVCIANLAVNPKDCPAEPANLAGDVGDIITVAVNIQGGDSLAGFDILVQVNPAVLEPVSIGLAHSLIQDPRFIVVQSADSTSGVARVAMVPLGYVVPGAGNLFEINYKVLSSSIGTSVIFMVGCTEGLGSSVQGVCVSLANANANVLPVKVRAASFGPITPDFFISVAPTYLPVRAGFGRNTTIVLGSIGTFNGVVNLSSAPVSPCIASNCPSLSLNSTTVSLSPGGTGSTTITLSAPPERFDAPVVHWSINVSGTSGNLSHAVTVTLTVLPPDFSLLWSAGNIVWSGSTAATPIRLRSIGGFGTVNLTLNPSQFDCLGASSCPSSSWSLSSTNLTLVPGATAQTTLTFSAPYPPDGMSWVDYYKNVGATSGSTSHFIDVYFIVAPRNFTININPAIVTITRGQSTYARVYASSWFKTSVSVAIDPDMKKGPSITWPYYTGPTCPGYNCWFGPFLLVPTNTTTHPGTYTVTVTASNGWFTHTATLTLIVVPNPNDPKIH